MKPSDARFKIGFSDKTWFKKGHKLSAESIEKMRRAKTKFTPEELKEREKSRAKDPDRMAWKISYNKSPRRKFGVYKNSARIKSLDFDLTFEQFMTLWHKPCSYCQEKIDTIGVDRLDNSIGYTISNVISCCKTCNYMKRELPLLDFLARCEKVFKFHNPFLF